MQTQHTASEATPTRRRRLVAGTALLLALATAGAAVVDAHGGAHRHRQDADVMVQGGDGIHAENGARLFRTDRSVEVRWRVPTPEPGSYEYPTPDMVPPGAPLHPPLEPGYPEVFTLWMFTFDFPELCTDGVCDGDDVGDGTAARGSVYQVDGDIAYRHKLRLGGKVRLGQPAANGLGLANPLTAEVHVAMAPHAAALDGADLVRQLNSPVGGPPLWWAAIFIAD